MPKYYINIERNSTVYRDDEGDECANVGVALNEMRRALFNMGKEMVSTSDTWEITGTLRDSTQEICRVRLSVAQTLV